MNRSSVAGTLVSQCHGQKIGLKGFLDPSTATRQVMTSYSIMHGVTFSIVNLERLLLRL